MTSRVRKAYLGLAAFGRFTLQGLTGVGQLGRVFRGEEGARPPVTPYKKQHQRDQPNGEQRTKLGDDEGLADALCRTLEVGAQPRAFLLLHIVQQDTDRVAALLRGLDFLHQRCGRQGSDPRIGGIHRLPFVANPSLHGGKSVLLRRNVSGQRANAHDLVRQVLSRRTIAIERVGLASQHERTTIVRQFVGVGAQAGQGGQR